MNIKPFTIKSRWLKNPHLQTMLASCLHRPCQFRGQISSEHIDIYHQGQIKDHIELVWQNQSQACTKPILLLIHGLEGSVNSHYVQKLLSHNHALGNPLAIATLHFRGCKGRINQLAESYHAGRYDDINRAVQHLQQRYLSKQNRLFIAGFSLGANALAQYLARFQHTPAQACVLVSPPFSLAQSAQQFEKPSHFLYQSHFLKSLKQTVRAKMQAGIELPVSLEQLDLIKTIEQFDDWVTAPSHGFSSAQDYYQKNSCNQFITDIRVPTLLLHAKDDPLIPTASIPEQMLKQQQFINSEIYDHGGHIGFIEHHRELYRRHSDSWLARRIMGWLKEEGCY